MSVEGDHLEHADHGKVLDEISKGFYEILFYLHLSYTHQRARQKNLQTLSPSREGKRMQSASFKKPLRMEVDERAKDAVRAFKDILAMIPVYAPDIRPEILEKLTEDTEEITEFVFGDIEGYGTRYQELREGFGLDNQEFEFFIRGKELHEADDSDRFDPFYKLLGRESKE